MYTRIYTQHKRLFVFEIGNYPAVPTATVVIGIYSHTSISIEDNHIKLCLKPRNCGRRIDCCNDDAGVTSVVPICVARNVRTCI